MRVLVTAGNTQIPIDKVRSITNVFQGVTGFQIAKYLSDYMYGVTLLTSNEEHALQGGNNLRIELFRTFDELKTKMQDEITSGKYEAVIHSAAVSDYYVSQILDENGHVIDVDAETKISSAHSELRLIMKPTIKIIDQIREAWNFKGKLVKFKLQSGISDIKLIEIATESMRHSGADLIVANCKEWYKERAYIIDSQGVIYNTPRADLPKELYRRLG